MGWDDCRVKLGRDEEEGNIPNLTAVCTIAERWTAREPESPRSVTRLLLRYQSRCGIKCAIRVSSENAVKLRTTVEIHPHRTSARPSQSRSNPIVSVSPSLVQLESKW